MKRAIVLGLLASLACAPDDPPAPAATSAAEPSLATEPTPVPIPESTPTPASPPTATAEAKVPDPSATLPEGVELTHGYVIQVATKKQLADAKQLRSSLPADAEPFVLHGEKNWWVMAGRYVTFGDAELALPAIKAHLGEGGIIREVTKFCPGMRPLEADV